MFSLWCIDWDGSLYANRILCISILRVASGPRVKLAGPKSFNHSPTGGLFYWPFSCGDSGVSLALCCFEVYSTRRFVLCLILCYFVLVFFSPFSIAISSLGEERTNLSAFRTFVRFALVWFCLFPLPPRVWDGLRLVIVALTGLFSYIVFNIKWIMITQSALTLQRWLIFLHLYMYIRSILWVLWLLLEIRSIICIETCTLPRFWLVKYYIQLHAICRLYVSMGNHFGCGVCTKVMKTLASPFRSPVSSKMEMKLQRKDMLFF